MSLIQWNEEKFSIKVEQFDQDHKKLVDLINILHEKMMDGKGKDIMAPMLEDLQEYSQYHFKSEERMMRQYAYPDYETHKAEHDKFIKQRDELIEKFRAGTMKITIETFQFLKEWLMNHVQETDSKMGTFLARKMP